MLIYRENLFYGYIEVENSECEELHASGDPCLVSTRVIGKITMDVKNEHISKVDDENSDYIFSGELISQGAEGVRFHY